MNSSSQSSVQQRDVIQLYTAGKARSGAWLLVTSIVLISLVLRAPITSVGPIIDQIRESMGLSGGMSGLLTTLPLLAFGMMSPIAPRIAARLGMEFSLLSASALLTAAIVVRSLPSVYGLFIGTALLGTAIAVANVLLPSLVKRDYPGNVGLMTGVYTVAMNMGAAIGSGISVPLTEKLGFSWQSTIAATALVGLIATAAWLPLLKRRSNEAAAQVAISAARPDVIEERGGARSGKLWTSSLAWSVSLVLALQSFCFYVNVTWIPLILADKGLNHADAGWMLSLMQLVSMPSTFIFPILAGRSRNQQGLILITFILIVTGYLLLLLGGQALVPVSMVVLGFGAGGGFSLAVMFFALRTSTSGQAAELSGMAQSVGYLLAASGPFLFGVIHDWTGGWNVPLMLLLVVSVCYCVFGVMAAADRKV